MSNSYIYIYFFSWNSFFFFTHTPTQPIPIIQTVTPSEIATYGRSTLEIHGEDIASMLFESKVFIGDLPCLNVVKLTPTTLQCTAPKMSATASLGFTSVTVLIVTSNGTSTKVLKYGTPHVTSVLPRTIHSVGGQTVVVRGTLLGGTGGGLGFPDLPRIVLAGARSVKFYFIFIIFFFYFTIYIILLV